MPGKLIEVSAEGLEAGPALGSDGTSPEPADRLAGRLG